MPVRTISTKLAVEGEARYRQSIANCNSELRTLKSSLSLVESEFRGNANSMEALTAKHSALSAMQEAQKKKVDELQKALENCQRAQETYAERVSTAKENIERCEKSLGELKNSTGDTTKEQEALNAELEKWKNELSEAEAGEAAASKGVQDWQRQLNTANIELNNLDDEVEKNKQYLAEARGSVDRCATSIDEYGKEVKEAAEESAEFGEKASNGVEALAAVLAAAGIAATVKEITAALLECAGASASFETSLAKVSTLVDTSIVPMEQIKEGLVSLSSETGASVESLAEATYQALSAGVNAANVVDFVSTATKLSTAGFTEGATAVDVLTTALNAYGLQGSEAERVASVLVKTQDLGKTSVDELAGSMGRVIPTAAAYNVSLDQLATSYAIITASGTNTRIATTNLAAMLNELASEGGNVAGILREKTGKSFAELMGQGKSLGDVISILSDSVNGDATAFSNLWSSSTAGQSALTLLNQGAEKFNTTLVAMENSSGSVDRNFQIMADTTEFAQQRMMTATENFKIAIGDQLTPALTNLYDAGATGFEWAADFVEENPWLVQAITAVTTGISVLTLGIAGYTAVTKLAAIAQEALNAIMEANPAFLVVTGITALTGAIAALALTAEREGQELRELMDSIQESKEAYEELTASMQEEQAGVRANADALKELLAVEEKSDGQKQTILNLIEKLNAKVPELGLAYDEVSDSLINMTKEELDTFITQAAIQEEAEAGVERLTEAYIEQARITAQLAEETEKYEAAVEAATGDTVIGRGAVLDMMDLQEEHAAVVAELEEKYGALRDQQAALNEEQEIYNQKQAVQQEAMAKTQEYVDSLCAEMENLEQQYIDACDEARKSIEGQLGLFKELDGTAQTSIGSLIDTLKGQVTYMDTYAANIQKAMELGVDKGLVEKLSDGSEESAQILAAIVQGGAEDIEELNKQLANVEEGKTNFTKTVADMETDFSKKMDELEKRQQDAVKNLNASIEASAAGVNTIQGYIDGAESMRSDLIAKYTSLANAANNAWKSTLDEHSPSRVFREHGKNTVLGAVEGVEENEMLLIQAIERMGEKAITAAAQSLPSSIEEPSRSAETRAQTEAIVRALDQKSSKAGNTYVTINSPEALDEKTAAREFKKVQRDIALGIT
ncbi:MAG: phage tail tape measure protein [Acutalibacter sp.]|nr:phage tail tape measure protein [Acutalibacter sp.]